MEKRALPDTARSKYAWNGICLQLDTGGRFFVYGFYTIMQINAEDVKVSCMKTKLLLF